MLATRMSIWDSPGTVTESRGSRLPVGRFAVLGCAAAVLLVVIAAATACSSPWERLPFVEVASGGLLAHDSYHGGPRLFVIVDEEQWAGFWSEYQPQDLNEEPSFTFDTELALVIFLGEKSSGGYVIRVHRVEQMAEKVQVVIESTLQAAMAPAIITQPYLILSIEKDALQHKGVLEFTLTDPAGEELFGQAFTIEPRASDRRLP